MSDPHFNFQSSTAPDDLALVLRWVVASVALGFALNVAGIAMMSATF